jgi:hypothetical protein
MVETPGDDQDGEAPADLWLKIHGEVFELTQDLESFDVNRAEKSVKNRQEVELLDSELQAELAVLETERERLADALSGFVQLRSQNISLQRKQAEEMEVLKSCNKHLMTRMEELSHHGNEKAEQVEYLCKHDAREHTEYHRMIELLERQQAGVAKACLEDVCETGELHVAELENETRALKERCAASRRRRKLALDGLRADLSLVAKKLSVLEQVAAQVSNTLGQMCSGVQGATSSTSQTTAKTAPLPQASASPYAQQRSYASPFAQRRSRQHVQSCGSMARGVMAARGARRGRGASRECRRSTLAR